MSHHGVLLERQGRWEAQSQSALEFVASAETCVLQQLPFL